MIGRNVCHVGERIPAQQHLHRIVEESDRRDGQQGADDSGKHTASGNGQHHGQRVNRHRPTHHQRLQ
ncbi:Uncharacterised protein [Mycobacterium tuberculosis]|nr:Uncharacterised protein [Mycobacterium tuberculosis]